MDKLKRSFSFRKKKEHVPECSKPHQWQEDERKVRDGTCSFQVRYLGCIEVFESRGMKVCEEAVKALKARSSRSVWSRMSLRSRKQRDQQCKGKYQRAILYVSGDALRVVDEISKLKSTQGLIVDQTIEKVSFCAPDRHHEKGFAYISRDGTTRRWMCHGFLALKESGERLSHAVGCAFAICLEKKQKREKESVSVAFNDKCTSFTRNGSFRQTTLTERLADPQSAIIAEPVPETSRDVTHAVQRPHASDSMLQRQLSFRIFDKLKDTSPFKRHGSLRLDDLPSTLERSKEFGKGGINGHSNGPGGVSPIQEASPTKENPDQESISNMCQQLTQGLSALTEDPFSAAPPPSNNTNPPIKYQPTTSTTLITQPQVHSNTNETNIPVVEPIRQNNPWMPSNQQQSARAVMPRPITQQSQKQPVTGISGQEVNKISREPRISEAEFWLNSTASSITIPSDHPDAFQQAIHNGSNHTMFSSPSPGTGVIPNVSPQPPIQQIHPAFIPGPLTGGVPELGPTGTPSIVPPGVVQSPGMIQPNLNVRHSLHTRSQSVDNTDNWWAASQKAPTLRELANTNNVAQFQSQQNGSTVNPAWTSIQSPPRPLPDADPFDAAWAAKASSQPASKAFEVKL